MRHVIMKELYREDYENGVSVVCKDTPWQNEGRNRSKVITCDCASTCIHISNVAAKTAVDWYNFIRDICAQYFIDHPAITGGPGVEVEIDESKFGKRKYNRGRQVEGQWVFGGTERITGECFLVEVKHRDTATLLPLIQHHIRPGSTIHSDEWKAYSRITATTGMTVNHSLHFADLATGVHTQGL